MRTADALLQHARTLPPDDLRRLAIAYNEVAADPGTHPGNVELFSLLADLFAECLYRQDLDFARLGDSLRHEV